MKTLADIIAFNNAHAGVALKFGQTQINPTLFRWPPGGNGSGVGVKPSLCGMPGCLWLVKGSRTPEGR